ncbi:MAG TPA: hypothetical protein VKM55_26450 [Candidatus Lokiarchaeia archaeon]|nr:hypothetical protein [Candidatus Lokiarchaeia archaeon]
MWSEKNKERRVPTIFCEQQRNCSFISNKINVTEAIYSLVIQFQYSTTEPRNRL